MEKPTRVVDLAETAGSWVLATSTTRIRALRRGAAHAVDAVSTAAGAGHQFAGDWVTGEARLHAALWNGVETGERLAEQN